MTAVLYAGCLVSCHYFWASFHASINNLGQVLLFSHLKL
jgi:hypothetical protein